MENTIIQWLLNCDEPWTRYRTRIDLLEESQNSDHVLAERADMIAHPQVQALVETAAGWPGYVFKRHNDAKHAIYKISTLADMGLQKDDPGMQAVIEAVLAHQAPEGSFESLTFIPKAFGGPNEDMWTWIACDAPTLLYALQSFGLEEDERVHKAIEHLGSLVEENGWRCKASPDLGKFKGPGKRQDPCPIANVYALKALSLAPQWIDSAATRAGIEMLLWHWAHRGEVKIFLFGIGTDFRKLKYPFVWYNILHVADILSRFPFVHEDTYLQEMVAEITAQADEQGRYTATSMYLAWKGWSFANKKQPSPWLTFLALRILKRMGIKETHADHFAA